MKSTVSMRIAIVAARAQEDSVARFAIRQLQDYLSVFENVGVFVTSVVMADEAFRTPDEAGNEGLPVCN